MKTASIKTKSQSLQFDLSTGNLSFHAAGHSKPALTEAYFGVSTPDQYHTSRTGTQRLARKVPAPAWLGKGQGLELACSGGAGPEVALQAFSYDKRPQLFLRLVVRNTTRSRLELKEMDLIKLAGLAKPNLNFASPLEDLSLFRHGWDSWDVSQTLKVRELSGLLVATMDSHLFSRVASLRGEASTLFGFLGAQGQAGHVKYVWSADGRHLKEFRVMAEALHWGLQPGESAESELLLLEAGNRGNGAYEEYLDLLAKAMAARVGTKVPAGWCSWYYYWGDVTEAAMLRNVKALKQRGAPLDLIQLDDGWQREVGDWTEVNGKFPHGLASLTKAIHQAGYQAGLWLAPFLVSERSNIFQKNPHWCIRDEDGGPLAYGYNWGGSNYCLDPTHPEVKQYLMRVFRTLTRDWQFDYFKLDFLHAGAMEGRFHNKALTRVQAFREGLALIRQLVGERFLLACGAPIGPCIGLVDAMRIGRDTGPKWDNGYDEVFADLRSKHPKAETYLRKLNEYVDIPLRGSLAFLRELMVSERFLAKWNSYGTAVGAVQDTLCRAAFQGRLWINDPDCLMLRDKDTVLTAEERRSLATAVGLSGGMVLLSDDTASLSDENWQEFDMLLPADPKPAQPLDLLERRIPRVFLKEVAAPWGRWHLAQLLNAGSHPKTMDLSLKRLGGLLTRFHVWDVWNEKYLGLHRGKLEVAQIAPHASRLLALRPDQGRPQLLGGSFHISQGAAEFASYSQDKNQIRFTFKKLGGRPRAGRLYFHLPEGLHLHNARASLGQVKISFVQSNVVCMEANALAGNEISLEIGR